MVINELARRTGVTAKTIRYYESIGLLPPPARTANNYRQYALADIERLRFIANARRLGISLDDILEILSARDQGIAPCQRVLDTISHRITAIDRQIAELLNLRAALQKLQSDGATLPLDDVDGEHCVCYLLKTYSDTGQVVIQKERIFND